MVKRTLLGRSCGKIWHSTYFTMLTGWSGAQVVTVYDMIYEFFPHLFSDDSSERFREQKRRCVLAADAVICISETTKNDVQNLYKLNSDRIWVVQPSCADTFRSMVGHVGNTSRLVPRPFLLYVGNRVHYKGFDTLVQAYSLWPQRSEIDLVTVGEDWSTDEVNYLMELGIFQQVHLMQDIDDKTLCVLYKTAEALLYPSLYEGFGIPLLEAMACGCPIVASRIPATMEVAGDVPIYFEAGKLDDLLVALDRALLEGKTSQRVLNGLKHVERYSWDRAAQQTLEIYEGL